MFARNLSDNGDMRPGPAHLVGPHLARGPARLLPALLEMAFGKVAIARGAGVRGDRESPSLADLQEESELGK
jgi:hypothetical protein